MGIFTRARDIVGANVNAALDKAENPEKLVAMMAREMEDTLIEVKASCASAMATKQKIEAEKTRTQDAVDQWEFRAQKAVNRGRDDLAREALLEKRRHHERLDALDQELTQCDEVVSQHQQDITKIEEKLKQVREKQRVLVHRHRRALNKRRAELEIRRIDTSNVMQRFDRFEQHVDRMEAEAELVNPATPPSLREAIDGLGTDDELEQELASLKASHH